MHFRRVLWNEAAVKASSVQRPLRSITQQTGVTNTSSCVSVPVNFPGAEDLRIPPYNSIKASTWLEDTASKSQG